MADQQNSEEAKTEEASQELWVDPLAHIPSSDIPGIENVEQCSESLKQMSAEDNEMLETVRSIFAERIIKNRTEDETLIRFVLGYSHEKPRKEKTIERLEEYFQWIEKWNYKDILNEDWEYETKCREAWQCYIYGQDKQGHCVLYDEVASCDPGLIVKTFNPNNSTDENERLEMIHKFRMRFLKRLDDRKREIRKKYGRLMYKQIVVMDASKFSMKHFSSQFRSTIKAVIGKEQHIFPEALEHLYVINAPWTFRSIWTILGAFIDPITYKKIDVVGSDYLKKMTKLISIDQIPQKFGGEGTAPIVNGGAFPSVQHPGTTKTNETN